MSGRTKEIDKDPQNSRFPVEDMNRGTPKYEERGQTATQQCSVN